ncbi:MULTISPECIES: hypothetical protein [unclassified Serratia (in: enterobacteria)]|uniref:GT99 family glycosyltransferase N-terminal domain-containing protein n=1 Tax=unclassified Serratia (in: enterobacteria) TaxID=2647522 RepID=UPI000500D606|nr:MULTISPECIES: hypothetical protein [unclassified Serratia (in: enterobacteria)]KFK97871.1 hypothetical protein JV45_00830 [Serratia sp. Ag2]KFL00262.1 hypothetical protein IV04_02140 [Serratia sp. Ag1]
MFATFLPPYAFRGVKAPYLWVFYRLLSSLKERSLFITGEDYLISPDEWQKNGRWEFDLATMTNLGYEIPSEQSLAQHDYFYLTESVFEELLASCNYNPIQAFRKMLTQRIPALEIKLHECLSGHSAEKIEGVLAICNCPSLEAVAESLSIPVLHIEVGPLRMPAYFNTGYLDFTGVNGHTEAEKRYSDIEGLCQVDVSADELHRYFLRDPYVNTQSIDADVGIVFQVEDDSNLIAYGNDFDNLTLLSYARMHYPQSSFLLRTHPASQFQIKSGDYDIDHSPMSLDFVHRCRHILTINSSVGLEGLLTGIPTTVLGDSSYKYVTQAKDEQEKVNRLAFYLFSYLVPFELLFDIDYLRFRIAQPDENAILNYHIEYYSTEKEGLLKMQGMTLGELVSKHVKLENEKQDVMQQEIKAAEHHLITDIEGKQSIISSLQEQLLLQQDQLALQQKQLEQLLLLQEQQQQQQQQEQQQQLYVQAQENSAERESLKKQVALLAQQLDENSIAMSNLRKSLSWRLTVPVRMTGRLVRGEFTVIRDIFRSYLRQRAASKSHSLIGKSWQAFRAHPHPYRVLLQKSKAAGKLLLTGRFGEFRQSLLRVAKNTTNTPMPLTSIDTDHVVILTTRHTLFVAHLLEKTLSEVGRGVTIIEAYSAAADNGQLHIVICPQIFSELPQNFVAFQMEQSINPRWFTPEYFAILERAMAIFDYSLTNISYLLEKGIPYQKLFYLPIGPYAGYEEQLIAKGHQLTSNETSVDVLFYGDTNCERRRGYLEQLGKRFRIHVASGVFGDELTCLVKSAKLVINLHYYENALLETTRIYEVLSLGTPIVSEESVDISEHSHLFDLIDFAPIGDIDAMAEKIERLLNESDYYTIRKQDIANFTRSNVMFDAYFKRYLLANDLIGFDVYKQSVDFIPRVDADIPKLCLSLTETPTRKQDFLSKPTHGFQVIEGVRHRIGWIGCGMSYKYMLSVLADRNAEIAMICEDDALFPEDFELKLEKIVSYLEHSGWDWHIFSGIIAHLNEDTEILAVEEVDGIEYIYINRMTSTVMNIYSRRGIDAVSHWDERNVDAQTNTIDRYLESVPNLVVVTTLPFLVGHAEDQTSTLWGFVNTQYLDMISESERLLQEKVDAFKASKAAQVV